MNLTKPNPDEFLELNIELFQHAATGRTRPNAKWLYIRTGKQLKEDFQTPIPFEDETEYLVVHKAKAPNDASFSASSSLISVHKAINIVFMRCQLSNFNIDSNHKRSCFFIHTNVSDSVSFKSAIIDNLYIFNSNLKKLHINRSTITNTWITGSNINDFVVKDRSKFSTINILDNSEIGTIAIHDNSAVATLAIEASKITSQLWVMKGTISFLEISTRSDLAAVVMMESAVTNVQIENHCSIERISMLDNSRVGSFHVESLCCESLILNHSSCEGFFMDKRCQVAEFRIADKSKCENLSVDLCYVQSLFINESEIKSIWLNQCYASLRLINTGRVSMQLTDCELFAVQLRGIVTGEFIITRGHIGTLDLSYFVLLKDSIFSVSRVQINRIILEEFIVQGQMLWRQISASSKVYHYTSAILSPAIIEITEDLQPYLEKYIHESDKLLEDGLNKVTVTTPPVLFLLFSSLGKSEISGSSLDRFNVVYRDSRMLEIFISGTKLPTRSVIIFSKGANHQLSDEQIEEQKISYYNQLKVIYSNHGNIVDASWFHAEAMMGQEKVMGSKFKNIKKFFFCKYFSEEAFDLLNVKLNRISNNHGESWRKAFLFTFFCTMASYILYYWVFHRRDQFDISEWTDFFGYYFSFLDFTHKIDFMAKPGEVVNAGARFFDLLGRVVTGYCIYQLVAAFRRHGRKGGA